MLSFDNFSVNDDSIALTDVSNNNNNSNNIINDPTSKRNKSSSKQREKLTKKEHQLPVIKTKINDHHPEEKREKMKSRRSESPSNNRLRSHSIQSGNPNRNVKIAPPGSGTSSRAKSAPIAEVSKSVKSAIDETLLNKPISEVILEDDYPELNNSGQLSIDETADVCVDFIEQFPLLSDKSEIIKNSPVRVDEDRIRQKKKVDQISPGRVRNTSNDYFEKETKKFTGTKKLAVDIIKKAREQVSNNKEFINRKISYSEVKLLTSPFAKKVFIPSANVENLMSDLSVSSWNNSVNS